MRKLLVECATLSVIGGIAGFALAFFGVRLLRGVVPAGIADVSPVRLEYRVLFVTAVIALGSGPLFGILPALVATRGDLHDALRSTAPSGAFGSIRRLGRLLVAFEIAAALMLTVGAGLLAKSLIHVLQTDAGVNAAKVVSGRVALARLTYHMPADRRPFFRAVLAELTHAPGVQSAALVSVLPLRGDYAVRLSFDIPDAPPARRDERFAELITASTGYFETMRIPLVAGRFFSADDRAGAPPVAVVSQSLASANWPGESAIGKRILVGFQETVPRTIVGVVRDVRTESLDTKEHTQIYLPFDQSPSFEATIVARGSVPASVLAQHIQDAVRGADPHQFAYDLETMDAVVSATLVSRRTNVMLIGAFGGIAVVLSAIGIYALLAFGVAQRTREIGIRMALGAPRGNVARLVVWDGAVAALVGVVGGVAGAFALTRLLRSLLYEVSPLDPTTFAAAVVAVLGVVVLASYLPARRATHADPLIAIRAE